jgi:hypothetical protein
MSVELLHMYASEPLWMQPLHLQGLTVRMHVIQAFLNIYKRLKGSPPRIVHSGWHSKNAKTLSGSCDLACGGWQLSVC